MATKKPHLIETKYIKASLEIVWRCLTEKELLNKWWCEIQKMEYSCTNNLNFLGVFRTIFNKGNKNYTYDYIYLEIIPCKKLTFTNALKPDLSPSELMPAETITFELFPHEVGTRLVPDIKAKNFPELNTVFKSGSYDIWRYNLAILERLAEELQKTTTLQSSITPPSQP